jgi:hypothetical protein
VPQTPSAFNLDLVRASLGPDLTAPYRAAFGAVPWLTTGTLAWSAEDAPTVLRAWRRWTARRPERTLSAVRLGASEVAIDVAVQGDPWGVPSRLGALHDLAPALDTVTLVGPQLLLSPALVAAAEVALPAMAPHGALLRAAAAMPVGICLCVRYSPRAGYGLIGVGAAAELPRALAATDQAARGLADPVVHGSA